MIKSEKLYLIFAVGIVGVSTTLAHNAPAENQEPPLVREHPETHLRPDSPEIRTHPAADRFHNPEVLPQNLVTPDGGRIQSATTPQQAPGPARNASEAIKGVLGQRLPGIDLGICLGKMPVALRVQSERVQLRWPNREAAPLLNHI